MTKNQADELTETEIIERVLNGEKFLYELIIRRYNPYLYKVGRSYNYNHEDTQDLMQETFIDAYKSLGQFQGRSGFKTWIVRIMLNNCYRRKEKFSTRFETNKEVNENSKPMFTQINNDINQIVQSRELGKIIEEALANIPEDYRMVFSLREINGMSVAETSDLLGISESNVKVRLNRAKSMLKEQIEKTYSASELFEFHAVFCDAMVNRVMNVVNKIQE